MDATTDPLPIRSIPVPAAVASVAGCDCGGLHWHRTATPGQAGCSLWDLPAEQVEAAISAAERRIAEHTSELNAELRRRLADGSHP